MEFFTYGSVGGRRQLLALPETAMVGRRFFGQVGASPVDAFGSKAECPEIPPRVITVNGYRQSQSSRLVHIMKQIILVLITSYLTIHNSAFAWQVSQSDLQILTLLSKRQAFLSWQEEWRQHIPDLELTEFQFDKEWQIKKSIHDGLTV